MPARKTFAQLQAEHRRLSTLHFLDAAPGMALNAPLIRSALESVAVLASLDQVEADLAWLAEQLLVTLERVGNVTVATITERGRDVAAQRASVPGVARALPE